MSNNEPDMENLAFEPEMTFDDIKEWFKSHKNGYISDYYFVWGYFTFYRDGNISHFVPEDYDTADEMIIAKDIKPYKMKQLILALE